jgi:hypothetical protein
MPEVPSALEPALVRALEYLSEQEREDAARIAVMGTMGFPDMEIAARIGLSWRAMNRIRLTVQGGMIHSMTIDGCSYPEIRRTLGITEGAMASALGAVPNCVAA